MLRLNLTQSTMHPVNHYTNHSHLPNHFINHVPIAVAQGYFGIDEFNAGPAQLGYVLQVYQERFMYPEKLFRWQLQFHSFEADARSHRLLLISEMYFYIVF